MTLIWLFAWIFSGMPKVDAFGAWNGWGIAVTLAVVVDAAALVDWWHHRAQSIAPSTTRAKRVGRFAQHFVEMALAMMLGMVVLGALNTLVLIPAGDLALTGDYPQSHLLAMAVFMAVPMVAWMRLRGHGWEHGAEMAGAMVAPVALCIGGCAVGVLSPMAMLSLGHELMWVAMLGVMLFRWDHYAGEGHVHGAAIIAHAGTMS
jgi:hypothetical protein